MLRRLRDRLVRFAYACTRALNRVRRPVTLGVRALVVTADSAVLLVRHRYLSGLYLPGGRVARQESTLDALRRELHEETGLVLDGSETLAVHGVFFSELEGKRDHIVVYTVRIAAARLQTLVGTPSLEVAEVVVARLDALPADLSPATRRRLLAFAAGNGETGLW